MRGRFAALCAAILVGLSPAGVLPFAKVAAAVACASDEAKAVRSAVLERQPLEIAQKAEIAQQVIIPEPRIAALGEPSGPQQAQGPPLA
jgi:hypothetical protein